MLDWVGGVVAVVAVTGFALLLLVMLRIMAHELRGRDGDADARPGVMNEGERDGRA
ncbi:MAG: hypothetical protein JOZ41_17280 [Chloroflexi bacterium]|nr:hypothetical protein [Chloroflexota bacterium]